MVVGKAVERQGAGPLPSHADPVWQVNRGEGGRGGGVGGVGWGG
jgi:hypothetical protein